MALPPAYPSRTRNTAYKTIRAMVDWLKWRSPPIAYVENPGHVQLPYRVFSDHWQRLALYALNETHSEFTPNNWLQYYDSDAQNAKQTRPLTLYSHAHKAQLITKFNHLNDEAAVEALVEVEYHKIREGGYYYPQVQSGEIASFWIGVFSKGQPMPMEVGSKPSSPISAQPVWYGCC